MIHGPVARATVALRLAFGGPPRARPVEVYAEPVDRAPEPGFAILTGTEGPHVS